MDRAMAARRAGQPVELDPERLQVELQGVPVFAGVPVSFEPADLSRRLRGGEVTIRLDLGTGSGIGEAFGCDLTEAYVIENSAYST
jgi:glutamate N-acetyltransferase/amino-acid N-acetyltransferase